MKISGVSFDVEAGSNYVTFTHTALTSPGNAGTDNDFNSKTFPLASSYPNTNISASGINTSAATLPIKTMDATFSGSWE